VNDLYRNVSPKQNRILVTGGAGFIGSHLTDLSMKENNEVVVIDNLSTGKVGNLSKWMGQENFRFVKGDLLVPSDIEKAIEKCQKVFHFAGNADVRIGYSSPSIHFEQNVLCTYNLLEAMIKSDKCRTIVFTSTSTIYGEADSIPTPEAYGPLMPISLYGATKLACESLICGYCRTFGMNGIIIRFANVLGPRSGHGVVYDFIHKLRKDPHSLEILGDGNQNKSYMHVSDCVSGILKASTSVTTPIHIYNVGSPDQIKVKDIAKIVISEMGLKGVEIKLTGGVDGGRGWIGDVKDMLLDINRMIALGWQPKYDSASAVRLSVRAMLDGAKEG
jgi:UDP-glucose 4-epimerase